MYRTTELWPELACPSCHGDLAGEADSARCVRCGRRFPVTEGVAVMVDLDHLPKHLASQVSYFERERGFHAPTFTLLPSERRYVERWLDVFGPVPANQLIVDCGSGSGYMTIELARRGARVVACDLTLSSLVRLLQVAESEGVGERVLAVCCSADAIPVASSAAHGFVANAILEHLPDEHAALEEWNRVCSDSAMLMVTVPLNLWLTHPLFAAIHYLRDKQIGHLRRYRIQSLRAKLPAWDLERVYFTGHFQKAWKFLANMTGLFAFDEDQMEEIDATKAGRQYGASNVVSFWRRKSEI